MYELSPASQGTYWPATEKGPGKEHLRELLPSASSSHLVSQAEMQSENEGRSSQIIITAGGIEPHCNRLMKIYHSTGKNPPINDGQSVKLVCTCMSVFHLVEESHVLSFLVSITVRVSLPIHVAGYITMTTPTTYRAMYFTFPVF
mmetsp:Transcript_7257/g.14342  ORF Transcript_7257/g.14342 Transcript_7257/m.14342 type:complete len:145 (-) Transcript_7257:1303-1737(-)